MDIAKITARIQALRAKTVENGCTEAEAIAAAAKVAALLDQHDLFLTDLDRRADLCERGVFQIDRKRRMPLDAAITAIGHFCACRVWREKNAKGEIGYVFFGLRADVAVALYLADLIDLTVRTELGRYKTSSAYLRFRHNERALANTSFALGMASSIAEKLIAMKAERDQVNHASGRDLVLLKASIVEDELARLGVVLRRSASARRMVAPDAFDAGSAAGGAMTITAGIAKN